MHVSSRHGSSFRQEMKPCWYLKKEIRILKQPVLLSFFIYIKPCFKKKSFPWGWIITELLCSHISCLSTLMMIKNLSSPNGKFSYILTWTSNLSVWNNFRPFAKLLPWQLDLFFWKKIRSKGSSWFLSGNKNHKYSKNILCNKNDGKFSYTANQMWM